MVRTDSPLGICIAKVTPGTPAKASFRAPNRLWRRIGCARFKPIGLLGTIFARPSRARAFAERCAVLLAMIAIPVCLLGSSGCTGAPEQKLVRQWGLKQDTMDGRDMLIIRIGGGDLRLAVSCEPTDRSKDVIYISDIATGKPIMKFKCHGSYGAPELMYSGTGPWERDGPEWMDLNGDARFDILIDYQSKRASIRVDGRWVKATARDGDFLNRATTDDGNVYRFDPATGNWLTVRATSKPQAR